MPEWSHQKDNWQRHPVICAWNNGHECEWGIVFPYSRWLLTFNTQVSTIFIACPGDEKQTLGIKLPFLVMIIKNMKKYFSFEVQVLDDKNVRRRFRASNYQSTTRVKPFICTMPMRLDEGWNQIQFNLSDFTRRAYGTNYIETLRVQIHANCRIRRIYFSDRLYTEEELPQEFKLFLPIQKSWSMEGANSTLTCLRISWKIITVCSLFIKLR